MGSYERNISEPQHFKRVTINLSSLNMPLVWKFPSEEEKSKYFGKKGIFGKSATLDMFVYSPMEPKRPLIVSKQRSAKEAVLIANHVGAFMGDMPCPEDSSIVDECWQILKKMSDYNELIDETFAQIALQLNRHFILRNCIMGWKLMLILLCYYKPVSIESFVDTLCRMYTQDGDFDVSLLASNTFFDVELYFLK